MFIFSGEFKDQGFLDIAEKEVRLRLTHYKYTILEGTILRVIKEAEKKSPICNAGWLDTPEWRKIFYFSKPVYVSPPNGVLIKKSLAKELTKLMPLSLQKLLDQKPNWKLGVSRLYGEGIDPVLIKNDYQKNPKFVTVATSIRVHQMLATNRIQYTIGYPYEAGYYNRMMKTSDTLVYLPLTEAPSFVEVPMACPKTEWGFKVIGEINKVLETPGVLDSIEKQTRQFLFIPDEKAYRRAHREMLKKHYPKLLPNP